MKLLEKYLDDFEIHGRLLPAMAAFFPLILYGFVKGILYEGIQDAVCYSGLLMLMAYFASKFVRGCGKKVEKTLYDELGAMPTTIILRFSDDRIDMVTKERYHSILNERVTGLSLPMALVEETPESDEQYRSAMTVLRNYANSHRDKESRVYQELKEYNFWRNLYGIKWYAAIIYFLLAIRELFLLSSFNFTEVLKEPFRDYLPFVIMVAGFIGVVFLIKKDTVEERAFDYAKALAESCERYQS